MTMRKFACQPTASPLALSPRFSDPVWYFRCRSRQSQAWQLPRQSLQINLLAVAAYRFPLLRGLLCNKAKLIMDGSTQLYII